MHTAVAQQKQNKKGTKKTGQGIQADERNRQMCVCVVSCSMVVRCGLFLEGCLIHLGRDLLLDVFLFILGSTLPVSCLVCIVNGWIGLIIWVWHLR